jgi:hypothetical protein
VITMSELLKDQTYRTFLETKPDLPDFCRDKTKQASPPWVVYVQVHADGKWGKKEFWGYGKALKFFNAWIDRGCFDAAINNKRYPYAPPKRIARIKGKWVKDSKGNTVQATTVVHWKLPSALAVDQPQHNWCMYCRRPVVFKFLAKQRRLGAVDPTVPRCTICGASARIALPAHDRMFRVH